MHNLVEKSVKQYNTMHILYNNADFILYIISAKSDSFLGKFTNFDCEFLPNLLYYVV